MNKKNRFLRIGITALLALLMAGATGAMLAAALGMSSGTAAAWLSALATSALCVLAAWSGAGAIVALAIAAVAGGLTLAANASSLTALRNWMASFADPEIALDAVALAQAGTLLAGLTATLACAIYFALLSRRGATAFALLLYIALLIVCYAVNADLSFGYALPGLLAALAAFAFAGEVPRDVDAWRVLIPAGLAVALALALVPSNRLTWEPLERAAQIVRMAFEDYFRFTEERIPFTISTEGYNHAAEVEQTVVAQLGGPATPDDEPVMQVTADADVLLRGAIRRTYTGNSWVDEEAKIRYLYYDFTRRGIREDVLGMTGNDAFAPVNVEVEILDAGTSSLFVTGRLDAFHMDLDTAVYYNSIGEMFLSRQVEAGDHYSLTGWQPASAEALREAMLEARSDRDDAYDEIFNSCTQLPEGIEEGVYTLALELTRDLDNAYDKAAAIESWLRNNCVYTLEADYPDPARDFVSQFVLEDRAGYCSYFASAMTVMCRMAGLPARYVEGYFVRAGEDVIVTGEDAHAWTEVYFNGIGWVAFNPANGAGGGADGLSNQGIDDGDTAADASEDPGRGDPDATHAPDPTPTPPLPEDGSQTPPPEEQTDPTPSPTPDPGDQQGLFGGETPPPEDNPSPQSETPPEETPNDAGRNWTWLWIVLSILLLMLLIALAVWRVRARLRATDPVRLSAKAPTAAQAALILYRAILTLLAQTGQGPLNGETPGAFARRISAQQSNPDLVAFSDAVALAAYARAGVGRPTVEQGRRAYAALLGSLKKKERMRFALVRLFKGLGEFETIP